jgi:Holliday junction resolvase RusA-like endonuclease
VTDLRLTVYGHPEPKGSTKAFLPKGWKRPIVTSDNAKGKPWAQQITRAAMHAIAKANEGVIIEPTDREIPIAIYLHFFLARPASASKRIHYQTKKPDWDKLCRLVADSLTGVAFVDDSQICRAVIAKDFGQPERVEILVRSVEEIAVNQERELQLVLNL